MSILAWNCQDINQPAPMQHLRGLVSSYKPTILFISETLANDNQILRIAQTLQFQNHHSVPKIGRKGGLCLMWNNDVNVQILQTSQSYIHTIVTPRAPGQPWICTGIYGPPQPNARKDFWEDFPTLFHTTTTPWLLIGDFNEVMKQSEKKGGRLITYAQTQPFLTLIDQMGFLDLGFQGDPYTWTNNQQGSDNIQERLDRAVSNQQWRTANPHAAVTHLPRIASDRAPILLQIKSLDWQGNKNYKFEHLWLSHPQLLQVVNSAWNNLHDSDPQLNLQLKLISTGKTLTEWRKINFGHLPTLIKKSTAKIQEAQHQCATQRGPSLDHRLLVEKQLRMDHITLLDFHATYWQQRSRIQWLQTGDRNTTFFHTKATIHRSCNNIQQLKDQHNNWIQDKNAIINLMIDHFTDQYTAPNTAIDEMLFKDIKPRLTPQQCASSLWK